MNLTLKPYARLAAMGAFGVSAGALGLYLLIGFFSRPTASGGIDATHAALTWISLAVPIAAVIAAHLVYGWILLRYARE
ncbi:MAG TPA: hypothetical protein VLE53_09285 [Gemmatimonadaceae bacterium]|nr:hypothetical protein [Gemmatimonadaceae bacterium]